MKKLDRMIWAVGGGKGGVGKSIIAANLACGLAMEGNRVVLVDADLAGANMHTLFGIKYPERSLTDFLKKEVEGFTDILIPTDIRNLSLICGVSDLLELANPLHVQKQRLIGGIASLDAEYIIIDIGAGSTLNNIDFFNMADAGIIVTSSTPTAVQSAYTFLKMALHRKILDLFSDVPSLKDNMSDALKDGKKGMVDLVAMVKKIDEAASWKIVKTLVERRYRLIVNMASEVEGLRISNALAGLAYQSLRVKVPCLGTLGLSPEIEQSVQRMRPIMLTENSFTAHAIRKITQKIREESLQHAVQRPAAGNIPVQKAAVKEEIPPEGMREDLLEEEPSQKMRGEEQGPQRSEEKRQEPRRDLRYEAAWTRSTIQLCLKEEVIYDGVTLHVQTEDLGVEQASVLTLVFRGGHILFSKATEYSEFADANHLERSVAERVRWQQRAIIAGVLAGKLKDRMHAGGGPG